MGSRPRKRKDELQTIELRPIHLGLLAASLQGFEPHALDQVVELVHCLVVEDEAVVAVVPAQDLTQPMWFWIEFRAASLRKNWSAIYEAVTSRK